MKTNLILTTLDFTQAKPVTLPHDWSIGHNFEAQASAGGAGGYQPTARLTLK